MVSMLTRVQQRRGIASQWTAANPILAQGEIGLEVDTNTFKLGNGLTRWNDLPYLSGPTGDSAYEVAASNGFPGTEVEWLLSLSGYGIAVANGFVGTQAQWLASLVGPQGIQGATGPIGPTGATGIEWQGEWDNSVNYVNNDAVFYSGASWFASGDPDIGDEPSEESLFWYPLALQGATGPQGIQGIQGETGPQGIQGETGPQGIQGETGPQGVQGIQGETGLQGIQGEQGIQGIQGETGETGAGLNILGTLNDETELPLTGSAGDAYIVEGDLYIWDGNPDWNNVGQIVGPAGASVTISSTAPSGIIDEGALWYDPDDGVTYIYYNDGDSSQWVQL
ncbi:MAG: hypothetical protein WAO78_18020 [Roseovarius sp.]